MAEAKNIVITPQPGGQTTFLKKIFVDEVLFGGAAGPGKSWALVYDALGTQYRHTPLSCAAYQCADYRAVLFRRKTTQFSKLIDEGKKLYIPLGAVFVQKRTGDPGPSFNFPSGARIFICHMEMENDKESHQGVEYQYCGFDELTQFTVTQYTYLLSRLRSTIKHLNCRIRATTNPTGAGLIWVKKRFIKDAANVLKYNTVYNFEPDRSNKLEVNPQGKLVEKKTKYSKSRMFVPGLLDENKILMKTDPSYKLNIMAMGKKYEEALLHGNWDAFGGDFFDDFNRNSMEMEPFPIPNDWALYGSLDPGWSSPCSFGLHAASPRGAIIRLFTYYESGLSPQEHARNIKQRIEEFAYTRGKYPSIIVSGTDAFAKKERFAIKGTDLTFADMFLNEGLYLSRAKTDRILGWQAFKQILRMQKWYYFKDFNNPLIDEMTSVEHDEKNPEDITGRGCDPNVPDHALDENRYGIMAIRTPEQLQKEGEVYARSFIEEMEAETRETTF